jgi:hypothetical protein
MKGTTFILEWVGARQGVGAWLGDPLCEGKVRLFIGIHITWLVLEICGQI